jgi:hypothetical protein
VHRQGGKRGPHVRRSGRHPTVSYARRRSSAARTSDGTHRYVAVCTAQRTTSTTSAASGWPPSRTGSRSMTSSRRRGKPSTASCVSAKFAPITTVADLRATTHARPGLALYGLLELRRATDRRVAELDRRVQQQLSALARCPTRPSTRSTCCAPPSRRSPSSGTRSSSRSTACAAAGAGRCASGYVDETSPRAARCTTTAPGDRVPRCPPRASRRPTSTRLGAAAVVRSRHRV